jgi:GGDEF domain-containing protein
LKDLTREGDVCGRFQGDDFIVLADRNPDDETLSELCRRLSTGLVFQADLDSVKVQVSASMGSAVFPDSGSSLEEVLAAAQSSLRDAKASGKPFEAATGADLVGAPSTSANVSVTERQIDRRGERRQRVLKPGLIVLPGSDSVVDCTIRDISSGGARLRVDGYFAPPARFDLILVGTGERRPVRVRWQVGTEVGVQFVGKDNGRP